ncbi:TIGR04104 family putative zinc finger protein [Gottfriedia acidiceleris]|uniref:TIGR04104 family putative zinc finger protein n=1 Tax=Gottfriedia acidiceleris TaxID=371036 RepID=UPI0030002125
MNLPKCNNCGHQFSWKSIHKSLFKFNQELKCINCKLMLYPTIKSRKKTGFHILVFLLLGFVLQVISVPLKISVLILGITGLTYLIFLPFLFSFIDREESLL